MLWQARQGFIAGRGAIDAAAGGGGFVDPSSIADLALWFEPGRGGLFQDNTGTTTVAVANGDVVGFLPDFNAGLFNLSSVANDTTRPTLQGVGVKPYILFDGVNDVLRQTSSIGAYAAGAATYFMTLRGATAALGANLIAEGRSSSANPIHAPMCVSASTATTAAAVIRNDSGTAILANTTAVQTTVFDGSDHVYCIVDNGSSLTPYLDGVAGTAVNYTRAGVMTLDRFAIGALIRTTTGGFCSVRAYGGAIYKRALNSTEIGNMNTYMAALK